MSKQIQTKMSSLNSELVHLSYREVKEETYRALRQAGFTWGQAQAAGRVSGISESIWGTGISGVLEDCSFSLLRSRKVSQKNTSVGASINTHGLSLNLAGPAIVALAHGLTNTYISVRGTSSGIAIAASFWDMPTDGKLSFVWSDGSEENDSVFGINFAGDLVKVTSLEQLPQHDLPKKKGWWALASHEDVKGKFVLTTEERNEILRGASENGVSVDSEKWAKLKKLSTRFLVPE